jgi:hypothetical protein
VGGSAIVCLPVVVTTVEATPAVLTSRVVEALALGSRCLVAVSCLVLSKTYPSRTKIVRRVAMRSLNSARVLALTAPCLVFSRVFVCYCTAHRQHRMLRMFQAKNLDHT